MQPQKIFLRLVSSICLISQVSCISGDDTHMDRIASTHADTAGVALTNSTKNCITAFDTAGAEVYEYKSASLKQELVVQRLSKLSISFRLTTQLPRTGEMEMVQGKAIATESSNAEEDEDEEGMSYCKETHKASLLYETGKVLRRRR